MTRDAVKGSFMSPDDMNESFMTSGGNPALGNDMNESFMSPDDMNESFLSSEPGR